MDKNQFEMSIAKYTVFAVVPVFIISIVISIIVCLYGLVGAAHIDGDWYEAVLLFSRTFKKTISLAFSSVVAFLAIDVTVYKMANKENKRYSFMPRIDSNKKIHRLEIVIVNLAVYCFLVMGQLDIWIENIFYGMTLKEHFYDTIAVYTQRAGLVLFFLAMGCGIVSFIIFVLGKRQKPQNKDKKIRK